MKNTDDEKLINEETECCEDNNCCKDGENLKNDECCKDGECCQEDNSSENDECCKDGECCQEDNSSENDECCKDANNSSDDESCEVVFNNKTKPSHNKIVVPYVVSIVALLIAVISLVLPSTDSNKVVLYTSNNTNQNVSTSTGNGLTNVVSSVSNSVVDIETEILSQTIFGTSTGFSSGSGVIISNDGYIVTNQHVVAGANKLTVTLNNGATYEAAVIGADPNNDLAVVKIDEKNLQAATFGDSSSVQTGQQVFAIGNPTGELGGSVTFGFISATSRFITVEDKQYVAMQHDAAVSPGSSGGGLFDTNGNLVGIVSAKSVSQDIEGIGFAIPANEAKDIVADLIEFGYVKKPVIGITVVSILTEDAALYNRVDELGIYIQSVALNSDANRQGLKVGDLIVEIDDVKIESTSDIQQVLSKKDIGDSIDITIKRDGTFVDYTVELIDSIN